MMPNPYRVLGVSTFDSIVDIQKRYRLLSRKYHPDNGGDSTKFMEVQTAWSELKKIHEALGDKPMVGYHHKTLFTLVKD